MEMRGGMASDNGYYMGMILSSYVKGGNKWVYGAEYLHMRHGHRHVTIPSAQFMAEGEYYLNFLSDTGKAFFLDLGGSALAGYETVNRSDKKLYGGATLRYGDVFAYGCVLTLEMKLHLAGRVVLMVSLRERFLQGGSLGYCCTQYGIGIRFMVNQRAMEPEQVRQISLVGFLEGMGHISVLCKGNDVWFRSPFKSERIASFKVDTQRNVWSGFGIGKGDDTLHLTGELTGSTGSVEQLEFLSGEPGIPPLRPLQERKEIPRVSGSEDVKATELSHEALKDYLRGRGVDPAVVGGFCKEVVYGIRGKRYFTIGSMNRSSGHEPHSPMFKGYISPKDISCMSLFGKKQDMYYTFEGFIDFSFALVLRTVEDENCLVLSFIFSLERPHAVPEGYGKIQRSFDHDRAGITVLEILTVHFGNKVTDCSGLYDGFKDLNKYLTRAKENKRRQKRI